MAKKAVKTVVDTAAPTLPEKSFKDLAIEDTQSMLDKLDAVETTVESSAPEIGIDDVEIVETEKLPKTEVKPASQLGYQEYLETLTFDEFLGIFPDKHKIEISNRVNNITEKNIKDRFGRLNPLIEELQKNPKLMDQLEKLNDKDLREFLLEAGIEAYEEVNPGHVKKFQQDTKEREYQDKIAGYEADLTKRQREKAQAEYTERRIRERDAMLNDFPELRYTMEKVQKGDYSEPEFKKFAYIVDRAQEKTDLNYARGIQKEVSMREVYEEIRALENSRPNTTKIENSSTGASSAKSQQAPKSATEGLAKLKKTFGNSAFKAIAARDSGL
jgi:hypothetical protein